MQRSFRSAARFALPLALCVSAPRRLAAQVASADDHANRPRAVAVERTTPIVLDGVLGEAAWSAGVPAEGFRQFEPREGVPASQRTEVRFAYDGEALYVGARMYDSLGARGVRTRLVRRDKRSPIVACPPTAAWGCRRDLLGAAIAFAPPSASIECGERFGCLDVGTLQKEIHRLRFDASSPTPSVCSMSCQDSRSRIARAVGRSGTDVSVKSTRSAIVLL